MTAKRKKAQGTCTLWFEYLTSSAGDPIDKEGAAELRESCTRPRRDIRLRLRGSPVGQP